MMTELNSGWEKHIQMVLWRVRLMEIEMEIEIEMVLVQTKERLIKCLMGSSKSKSKGHQRG